jgi:hypothetical protein
MDMQRVGSAGFAACGVVVALAGCSSPAELCKTNEDCGDLLCTRDGACLPAGEIRRVQVAWSVNGQGASATACEGIVELQIRFVDFAGGDPHTFRQVPCGVGLFTIDRLSARFDQVELSGYDSGRRVVVEGEAAIVADEERTQVDLQDTSAR